MKARDIVKMVDSLGDSRKVGSQMGDKNGPRPEEASDYQLSRILDMLDAAVKAGLQASKIWDFIPSKWKVEFNYGNWKYSNIDV